jgi:branched-chain amino acid transport system substrate-binding protein
MNAKTQNISGGCPTRTPVRRNASLHAADAALKIAASFFRARKSLNFIRNDRFGRWPPALRNCGFAAMVLAAFSALSAPEAGAETLRIGLSLPLSGNAQLLGNQFLAGARLALSDSGRSGAVEIVAADDGCAAETAAKAALTLASANLTLAGGFLCNEAVPPAAAALKQAGVPLLLSGARSSLLLSDGVREGWNLFRIAPGDGRQAEAAFLLLEQRWKGLPWALVDDGTVFGRTLSDDLRARMEEAGHPPVFVDNFRPAQSTQASLVRRLQTAGAAAAFIAGDADDVAIIWANAREAGLAIEIAGGETLALLPYSQAAQGLPPGLLAVSEEDVTKGSEAQALLARLLAEGIEPEPHVVLGYASMQVALAAIAPTPLETTARLRNGVFQTVAGPVSFALDGQNVHDSYSLQSWNGRAFEPAEGAAQ